MSRVFRVPTRLCVGVLSISEKGTGMCGVDLAGTIHSQRMMYRQQACSNAPRSPQDWERGNPSPSFQQL